ncbi:MAG: hypothetical protein U1E45_22820 [Geminicoccaceae bacterium]
MAYQSKSLSALAYANGFTLWHYRTADLATDVDTTGYFNAAVKMMRVGDFVMVNSGVGTAAPAHGIMIVVSNDGTIVDLSNATALGTADTD